MAQKMALPARVGMYCNWPYSLTLQVAYVQFSGSKLGLAVLLDMMRLGEVVGFVNVFNMRGKLG